MKNTLKTLALPALLIVWSAGMTSCDDNCGWWDKINGNCNSLGFPEVPNLYGTSPSYAPGAPGLVFVGDPGVY